MLFQGERAKITNSYNSHQDLEVKLHFSVMPRLGRKGDNLNMSFKHGSQKWKEIVRTENFLRIKMVG